MNPIDFETRVAIASAQLDADIHMAFRALFPARSERRARWLASVEARNQLRKSINIARGGTGLNPLLGGRW